VFVATGDCGSSDGTSGVSTDYPASDPSAVAVGGTYLSVSGSGVYESEVGWGGNSSGASSPGCQNQGGSGGGFSPFPRPYWQAGVGVPSSPSTRGVPDVSADASNGVTIVQFNDEESVGGTSLATPIWAGFAALADQFVGHDLGQLDPAVYTVLRGSNYSTDFHDVTSGNNGYSAGTGWDPVTGVGTPIVGLLVKDLGKQSLSPSDLRVLLYTNRTSGPTPLLVRFAVAPSGGSGTYPLEGVYFGDGTSALTTDGVVTHTFARAGVYTTVAFVADSSGNLSSSIPVAIVVGGGGSLDVTLTPSTLIPTVGAGVTFTATVHGGSAPYGYVYSFGDGTFLNLSGSATVVHAFEIAGGFCADVIANDSATPVDGARSSPVAIAVGGAPAPVCSNATAPLTITADATPTVRDAPADFPSLFQVNGGASDPTEMLSSSDPYVGACGCTIFRSPGTYSVVLTVTDVIGDRATNETNVTVAPPLVGTFSSTSTYGIAPLTVQFGVTLGGGYLVNANDTTWNFGDGARATGAVVEHTYTTPGFYSATGDSSDRGHGNASEGFLIDVLPTESAGVPALSATFAPAVNLSSGTTVHFGATTTYLDGSSAPAQLFWTLGEGGTAWGTSTTQTYYAGASGLSPYLYATVTADWSDGATSTDATLATPQLLASESGGFTPAANGLEFTATGQPSAGPPGLLWTGTGEVTAPGGGALNWSFGDGGSATGVTTTHPFLTTGNYSVNASASDSWGDLGWASFGVQVGPAAIPAFSVGGGPSSESGQAPLSVTFTADATGGAVPYTYAWSTGDGGSNSSASFVHTYTLPGSFNSSVTVRDRLGASVVLNWTILVGASPTPSKSQSSSSLVIYVILGGVVAALAVATGAIWARRRDPPTTP
jgi:PKD repeat protein